MVLASDTSNSISIDLVSSCFLSEGKRTGICRIELKVGSVLRLENYGSEWFVDGKLVASMNSDQSRVFKVVKNKQAKVSVIENDTGIANSPF
jgi:hypothetical protein